MSTFVELSKPYMMPGGGVANSGENIGFDPVTAANLIAAGAEAGSAPGAQSTPALTRVKFTGLTGSVMVGGVPPLFGPGDIAGFPAATAAALIASGAAVSN